MDETRRRAFLRPSGCAAAVLAAVLATAGAAPPPRATALGPVLRVCADPNNLPFSSARGEGFENRLAALIAREMGAMVHYTWWPQRRGFVRETLDAGRCDAVMGVPAGFERTATTRAYYRSSYVFVSRRGDARGADRVRRFDDPRLGTLRIGVHLVGDDYANTPPAHALARRGLVGNVRGYTLYGDYREPDPPAALITAVARGDIDLAVAWGPLAGYVAHRTSPPLHLVPVTPPADMPGFPFTYAIAVGTRRDDEERRRAIDAILARRHAEIDALLDDYHVPRVR